MIDAIVVGSGASAVQAAVPLVEAGLDVVMVDVGERDDRYASLIPPETFDHLRRTDDRQHRYLLGDAFEGVPFGPVRVGAQLTPPRQFLTRGADRHAPTDAPGFQAMNSLALGGLAAGWGASTMPLLDAEMDGWPIRRAELQPHYDAVARRIGIAAPRRDDLSAWLGPVDGTLPPTPTDSNGEAFLRAYAAKRDRLRAMGFRAGHPRLAVCTREHAGRGPLACRDMEFWSDGDRAVYRPRYTVEDLSRRANFRYVDATLAMAFREDPDGVTLSARGTRDGAAVELRARALVLAAGTFGTARIVLRSLGRFGERLPLASNPYTYLPCLMPGRIGRPSRDRRHSLTQVTMLYDPDGTGAPPVQPQLYSYRSLLLFKLAKESPLAVRESLPLMRAIQDAFAIVGVFHEDRPSPGKHVSLDKDERLRVRWAQGDDDVQRQRGLERGVTRILRSLGCWPLRRIDPGPGSSIHYAGTLPMTDDGGPMTCSPDGALRAASRVTIADGSLLPHLPAKGLTFTLMANADRVGTALARRLLAEAGR